MFGSLLPFNGNGSGKLVGNGIKALSQSLNFFRFFLSSFLLFSITYARTLIPIVVLVVFRTCDSIYDGANIYYTLLKYKCLAFAPRKEQWQKNVNFTLVERNESGNSLMFTTQQVRNSTKDLCVEIANWWAIIFKFISFYHPIKVSQIFQHFYFVLFFRWNIVIDSFCLIKTWTK